MARDEVTAQVIRGTESWTYIYIVLGFAIAIEGMVIQMIEPLRYPSNLVVFAVLAVFTFMMLLFCGPLQNWLIGIKAKYENKAR
jgi:cytochrome b subunit of formate dehydrogenase